ncbi:MAG TPA: ParB/RepB/Spo0J family partition protein [Azospirillaceae bacterium]|nr:ParB/RepB/Spo0J family partition protein [Azospirillaceae bacterium]
MAKNWRKTDAADALAKGLRGVGSDFLFGGGDGWRETVSLRLGDIEPNPEQPRRHFDEEELARLAESLVSVGQLCPVLVRAHPQERRRYLLIAGERRWRAAAVAGLTSLTAHILPDEVNDAQIALIENLQRVNLSPIEEAEGVQRLIDSHGYSQEEAGALLGRSRTEITTTLTLLRLIPDVRAECATSHTQLSKAVLLEVAKMPPEEQRRVWPQARAGGLTVRVAREVRKGRAGAGGADVYGRLIAGFSRLQAELEAGLGALDGAPPPPPASSELRELRRRLADCAAALDRLLERSA